MADSLAFESTGSTISVSAGTPATFDITGYAALTFTEIGEVTDVGALERAFGEATHVPVAEGETYKFKGAANNGTMTLSMARVGGADAGQTILIAAAAARTNYSFKVVTPDTTIYYFRAMVGGYPVTIGASGNVVTSSVPLLVQPGIVEDAPA